MGMYVDMGAKENVIIVSHTMLYGAPHALRDYLLKKDNHSLLFISLPFYEQRVASYTRYKDGVVEKEVSVARSKSFGFFDYLIDCLQVFWWVANQRGKSSLFVGVNPINCIVGIFFRKIRKTKKVIFYSIDFTPRRFKNPLINFFYHKLEVFCIAYANETWNVSPRIAEGREEFLNLSKNVYPQKIVPIGVWNNEIRKVAPHRIKKHQLVFLGHLLEKQGVQMVLEAIPLIVSNIPDFIFVVIGGGEYEKPLKKIVEKLHIEKYVTFKGWIKEKKEVNTILKESAIAIAPYKPEKEKLYNFTYYADPTKIKDYLANGLPVILTNVSYNADVLKEKKCGIVVEYAPKAIADAVLEILTDEQMLMQYRVNALEYVVEFSWERIFDTAFEN